MRGIFMGVDKLNQPIDTNELMTLDDMANGHLDVATLGEAANEDKVITSRLGKQFLSAPMASRLLVENGLLGATPFSTYATMVTSALVDNDYAIVTNDADMGKNGFYQKQLGSWVFLRWNPVSQMIKISNRPVLYFRSAISVNKFKKTVTFPNCLAMRGNNSYQTCPESTHDLAASGRAKVFYYDNLSNSVKIKEGSKAGMPDGGDYALIALSYPSGIIFTSPYVWTDESETSVSYRLANKIQNGNLDDYGAGANVYGDIRYNGTDLAPVIKTSVADLNNYNCMYAFDLNTKSKLTGNFLTFEIDTPKTAAMGFFASMLIYSEDANWSGIEPLIYNLKKDRQTGSITAHNSGKLTTYEQLTPSLRLYYIYYNYPVMPLETEYLHSINLGARRTGNFNYLVSGFWFSQSMGSTARGSVITSKDTAFPNFDNVEKKPDYSDFSKTQKTPIENLVDALDNPLHSIKIRFLGDSITWGVGSSNTATGSPRSHKLTDPRNNITNDSYVNLVRRWLGYTYLDESTQHEILLTGGSHSGESYFEKNFIIDPFKASSGVKFLTDLHAKKPIPEDKINVLTRGQTTLGYHVDISRRDTVPELYLYNAGVEFELIGDNFTVIYAGQTAGTNTFLDIYIDDILYSSLDYSLNPVWNAEHAVNFDFGAHKVRMVNRSIDGGTFRFEALKVTKKIFIANDGISGTWSREWLPGTHLYSAVKDTDEFIFIQLGTNDRGYNAVKPYTAQKTKANLLAISNALKDRGMQIILMAANSATNDKEDPAIYKYNQGDVARITKEVANELGLSFINNYQATACLKAEGLDSAYTTDGLHPNDAGHRILYENIKSSILATAN